MKAGAATGTQILPFARVHTRELLRSKRALVALLVSFATLPVLFWGIDILIATATGGPGGLLRTSLPLIAVTGFMAVALILTTVQLVTYRSNGVLRQLATTPARRTAFPNATPPRLRNLGELAPNLLPWTSGLRTLGSQSKEASKLVGWKGRDRHRFVNLSSYLSCGDGRRFLTEERLRMGGVGLIATTL